MNPRQDSELLNRLGEAVWLMLQVPEYREADLPRVEALVLQPLMLDQLRIFKRGTRPVGLVSWAWLDEATQARYLETGVLEPEDWRSGDRLWFPDIIAPFGDVKDVTRAARAVIPAGSYGCGTRRNPDGSIRRIAKYAPFNSRNSV